MEMPSSSIEEASSRRHRSRSVHMLARLPQRRRQPCQAIGVNGDGLIRMAPAMMHLAMTQVNAPPSFFDETPLVASSVWRGARGNARELPAPVRDMPLIRVRTWCITHPHCSCAMAMHLLRASAGALRLR